MVKKFNMQKPQKAPISVVMIIYNEEKLLERALKSCINLVDEIVIIHDGNCSDKSIDIAKKYTDQVYIRKHMGACEYHRIFSYKHTKHDWILQLDGDEYLSPGLQKNIRLLIEAPVDIYDVSWPVQYKGKHFFGAYKRALYRKSKISYVAALHELVMPLSDKVRIQKTQYCIYNDPIYENVSMKTFKKKWVPWANLHARDLTTPFSKLDKWNYAGSDWNNVTKIRIEHPLLLGICGSACFHFAKDTIRAIKNRSLYYFIEGGYIALYFIVLYYKVYVLQRRKKI